MPGHFTHVYLARRVADLLGNGFDDWPRDHPPELSPEALSAAMKRWPKFTATGAVGPDLFYFSQDYNNALIGPRSDELMLLLAAYYFYDFSDENDWEPLLLILEEISESLAAVVRFLMELDKIWKKFKQGWDDTIGPLVNAADSVLDDLTGGLVSAFQGTLSELVTGLKGIAQLELTTWQDIFTGFDTCVAKAFDEKSFLWSDMTHYRRTSDLARNLFRVARDADRLPSDGDWAPAPDSEISPCENRDDRTGQFTAFALGWMTHLGLDTIAHSFVNEQCGGPFRHHPQRHHLIENHIDAWNYRQAGAGTGLFTKDGIGANATFPDLSRSAFWYEVQFTPQNPCGQDRPERIADDRTKATRQVDTDGVMPMWMANGIVTALMDTFDRDDDAPPLGPRPKHPQIFGGSDFQNTIDENLLKDIIEKVTGHGLDRPFKDLLHDIAPTPPFHVPHGYPLPWQVRTVYFFMNTFFKLSFWGGWELDKPRRPDVFITPPAKDVDDLLQPPDFSGPSSSDPVEDVCDTIKSFFDWLQHEIDAAIKLAGDLVKMLASPGSYPVRLALYELAMCVWNIVCKTHEIMAHTGFLIPHGEQRYSDHELRLPDEIDLPLITLGHSADAAFKQALADAIDPLGNLDRNQDLMVDHEVDDPSYPYYTPMVLTPSGNRPVAARNTAWSTEDTIVTAEYHRPWAYPNLSPDTNRQLHPTPTELYDGSRPGTDLDDNRQPPPTDDRVRPGPYPRGTMPDVFFRGRPADVRARGQYEAARTPRATDSLNMRHLLIDTDLESPLGDAVPFAAYLIGRLTNDAGYDTQFNLDSDRAYGYLTWDWIRQNVGPADAPRSAVDQDDLGRKFVAPETWPSFSPHFVEPGNGPSVAMQFEYLRDEESPPNLTHKLPRGNR